MDDRKGVARITTRLAPCRCGCNGSDPWHQTTLERALRDVQELQGPPAPVRGYYRRPVAVATVKLPWGIEQVIQFRDGTTIERAGRIDPLPCWRLFDLR